MPKLTSIVWNFDDIESNLIAVEYDKEAIGYFRMNTNELVVLSDGTESPKIPLNVLRSIVNGYNDALMEAEYLLETALSAQVINCKFTYPMELDTLNYIIESYEDTVDRLITVGIGNKTEFNSVVTEKMLATIIFRMNQLKSKRLYILKY